MRSETNRVRQRAWCAGVVGFVCAALAAPVLAQDPPPSAAALVEAPDALFTRLSGEIDERSLALDEKLEAVAAGTADKATRDAARQEGPALHALLQARAEALDDASADLQDAVQSFSIEGTTELAREGHAASTLALWLGLVRTREWIGADGMTGAVMLGLLSLSLLKGVFLIVCAVFVYRRFDAWVVALRGGVVRSLGRGRLRLWLVPTLDAVAALLREALPLLVVLVLFDLVLVDAPREALFFRGFFVSWGIARVVSALVVVVAGSAWVTGREGLTLDARARLLAAVLLVRRATLAVLWLRWLLAGVVGAAALHDIAADLGVLVSALTLVSLLRRYREPLLRRVREQKPDGRLAGLAARHDHGITSWFVAAAAAVVLLYRRVFTLVRGLLLDSGQARRALTFLFRRRLEAAQAAPPRTPVESLPEPLRRAFADDALTLSPLSPAATELEHLVRAARLFLDGKGPAQSAAINGDSGAGRTVFLDTFGARLDGRVVTGTPPRRLVSEADASAFLGELLGFGGCRTDDDVVKRCNQMPRRVVIIDDAHLFLLRAGGGLEGYKTLVDVVARTIDRVFWVLAFHSHTFAYAQKVYGARNSFHPLVHLGAWSEYALTRLIDDKMSAAGYTAAFDDLVVDRVDGSAIETEVIGTAESFRRLLIDHCDSNPRAVMHFWLRSLEPDPIDKKVMRVRLFDAPSADDLEDLENQTRFLLASLFLHQRATAAELARSLRFSVQACEGSLLYLVGRGIVAVGDDGNARVVTHWDRAVTRFLVRKNLLLG